MVYIIRTVVEAAGGMSEVTGVWCVVFQTVDCLSWPVAALEATFSVMFARWKNVPIQPSVTVWCQGSCGFASWLAVTDSTGVWCNWYQSDFIGLEPQIRNISCVECCMCSAPWNSRLLADGHLLECSSCKLIADWVWPYLVKGGGLCEFLGVHCSCLLRFHGQRSPWCKA